MAVVVFPESDLYVIVTEPGSSAILVSSTPCLNVMFGSSEKTQRIFFSNDQWVRLHDGTEHRLLMKETSFVSVTSIMDMIP